MKLIHGMETNKAITNSSFPCIEQDNEFSIIEKKKSIVLLVSLKYSEVASVFITCKGNSRITTKVQHLP